MALYLQILSNMLNRLISLLYICIWCMAFSANAVLHHRANIPNHTKKVQFFENSVRTDISPGEAKYLVSIQLNGTILADLASDLGIVISPEQKQTYLDSLDGKTPTCGAFFVANSSGKFFIGSARHCLYFYEKELCARNFTIRSFATGDTGHCTRIVVDDQKSDFFIFEAEFDDPKSTSAGTESLVLALFIKNGKEELDVFGFPGDNERNSRPTKSSNCSLVPTSEDLDYSRAVWNFQSKSSQLENTTVTDANSDHFNAAHLLIWQNVVPLRHNCSVYGGNSGGPVVIKNSRVFVGLPFTYVASPEIFPVWSYGVLETAARLWYEKRVDFMANGISVEIINLSPANAH